ncbi:MAG: metal ABC transporter permease [Chitinophagales bacterium]|jgi:manganese/zinc/iron transport system permease protein|nr:metal ABC transporter permease [Bacteroidota bacterium]MBK7569867.1 metal ABC transporter permease [Bacteroidota bacterium]MBP9219997.1 metal ABC transporter permease [Chitinophagales bacterium]MBP9795289.1 metal ABC transporter permease [Chitinophagales bacterium]
MKTFFDFFSFSDPNVQFVVIGMILLGIGTATIGTFAFLRKRALTGDAIAHSVLPGVCLAFMIFDTRNLWVLLGGAFVTGWLSIIFVDLITKKTKLKPDTAIGLTLSVFFGIGILLLTFIQQSGNASQSGLNNFLFGKAAAMSTDDIRTMAVVSLFIIVVVVIFFKEFRLLSFDPDYAKSTGLPVNFLQLTLTTLTVLAVAAGIQAVGVVLMAALLITPPAAAKYWTDKLGKMILLSILFAVIGSVTGAYVSYANNKMPTGPWIVTMTSIIAVLSILFAPKKGVIPKMIIRKKYQNKMLRENILKELYHLEEKNPGKKSFTLSDIATEREMKTSNYVFGLRMLLRKDFVVKINEAYYLTEKGLEEGKRITRIHRLWEMYLTEKLNIASDHVHDDAEAIEHIITPEIEKRLIELLDKPEKDPHEKIIPY